MTNTMKLILATALLGTLALPAAAQVDVPAVTCGSFAAMDTAGQNTVSDALFTWARSTENASSCGTIPVQLGCGTNGKMETAEVRSLITTHCTGKPDSANMVEELRKADM